MKKSLIMTIIIFLLVGVLGGVVNAASARVSASASSVNIGETVRVTISIGEKAKMIKQNLIMYLVQKVNIIKNFHM